MKYALCKLISLTKLCLNLIGTCVISHSDTGLDVVIIKLLDFQPTASVHTLKEIRYTRLILLPENATGHGVDAEYV